MFKNISFSNTMLVTITGITIVFMVLFLLIMIIYGFGKVFTEKSNNKSDNKKTKDQKTVPAKTVLTSNVKTEDESELIAVITAAAMSMLNGDSKKYRVASIRRSDNIERPIWATAGILENIKPF